MPFEVLHLFYFSPLYQLSEFYFHLPRLSARDEAEELAARRRPDPADPEIRIYPGIFPLRIRLYQSVIAAHLCGKGMGEAVRFHGHAGIGCDFLPLLQSRCCGAL